MSWCRILEAEEGPYLVVALEGPEGWGIQASWQSGGRLMSAIMGASEFRGKEDCLEFLASLRVENARNMRAVTEEAMAMSAAQEVIEGAMRRGLH